MPDLLVAYCEPWETPLRTSKHHFIERLAEAGWRVLYVEVPASPLSILYRPRHFRAEILPRVLAGVRPVRRNVWALASVVPLPFHRMPAGLFDRLWLNALNQRALLARLRRAMATLGFERPTLLAYYPLTVPILDALAPSRVLFHMVDEWQGLAGIPRSMAVLTRQMLARADTTVVTSQRLYDRYRPFARDLALLRHGTDLALFEPVARLAVPPHPSVAGFPGPRIGYFGALQKLDFALIANVAAQRPAWSFLFVGPKHGPLAASVPAGLPPNVHLVDVLPRRDLPAFLAAMDAFWMPFQVNELTHSMCPIKLFEALSAGVPVVSSALDEVAAAGRGQVLLADGPDAHLAALGEAVADKDSVRRLARSRAVADTDWSERFAQFLPLLTGAPGPAAGHPEKPAGAPP